MRLKTLAVMGLCLLSNLGQARSVEIAVWHSFSGHLGEVFNDITDKFNHSQSNYRIKTKYKGNYTETLTSFVAAFRAHKAPPLIQVFEVGTATLLKPQGIIKPVHEVFTSAGMTINQSDFLPAIYHYYSDDNQRLLALPFNSSVPILYYNKTQFKQAGIDDEELPITWQQLEKVARQLMQAGVDCAYTSAYPSWIHLEAFSAIHRLPFDKTEESSQKVSYANQATIAHLSRLIDWEMKGYFQYGGRDSDPSALFTSGHCAMMTQSSGSYKSLKQMVSFELGVLSMPYDSTIVSKRGNSIIGGAALWVVQGFDAPTYQGIAHYLQFLAQPTMQAYWQVQTGYLPISKKALQLTSQLEDPAMRIAYKELIHEQGLYPRPRLGAYSQIRIINDEEMEAAIAQTKSAKKALNDAVIRVNHLLKRFAKNAG